MSATETRKALVRFLPGLEVFTGLHYDSDEFLVNQNWADYGVRVSWNLINLLSAPARLEQAESQEKVAIARRQALSMAVLSQLYVAYTAYRQADDLYQTNQAVATVEGDILEQLRRSERAQSNGRLAVIRGELNALVADLRRDLAFARAQNALGADLRHGRRRPAAGDDRGGLRRHPGRGDPDHPEGLADGRSVHALHHAAGGRGAGPAGDG
ncbi:MAG: TolC family protein [Candidatus Krumholzibacteriota bacterium]|nr:TolC family protein [Candidatus Krumholzibacteriota bacterium]